jgi:hypothetical protein
MVPNNFRGEFSVPVNGKFYNGAFTLNAIRIFCKERNIQWKDLNAALKDDPLDAIPALAFCGVKSEFNKKGKALNLKEEQFVANVLDDSEAFAMISDALMKAFDTEDENKVDTKAGN